MKIVLDANVIVSAFGTRGLCAEVFTYCLMEHQIVSSDFVISEVISALETNFRMPAPRTAKYRRFLKEQTRVVKPLRVPRHACRDARDLKILGASLAGRADIIVTGDKDLLQLKEFRGIAIMGVREFWERTH